jgi:thiol-disulfide isomerase/thioredoxin
MKRKLYIVLAFFLYFTLVSAQNEKPINIKVVNFDQLEPYLHLKTDTLYLVNFWATWCTACVAELPVLKSIEGKYKNNKFKIYMVSLDMPSQLNSRLYPFVVSKKITSQVFLLNDPNQNKWINKVDSTWNGEIPYTLIYNNYSRESHPYSFTFQSLDTIINQKLTKP